jgi:hypothetical protein
MSWEDIIKFGSPWSRSGTKEEREERKQRRAEKYNEARLNSFGTWEGKDYRTEIIRIEKIFEKHLKGSSLTPLKAKRLIDFYEKLQGNKLSEDELKDIAFVYTQGR